jgi:hypothetical protein
MNCLFDGTFKLKTENAEKVDVLAKKAGFKNYVFDITRKLLVTFGSEEDLKRLTGLFARDGVLEDHNLVANIYPPNFIRLKDESRLGDHVVKFFLKNSAFHFDPIDRFMEENDLTLDEEMVGGDTEFPEGAFVSIRGERGSVEKFIQFAVKARCLKIHRVDFGPWKPDTKMVRLKRYLHSVMFRNDILESEKSQKKEKKYWRRKYFESQKGKV